MMEKDMEDQKGKIRVVADPDIKDLIPNYLENRRVDIEKIKNSLKMKDYDTVRTVGHQMKGSGSGYGFQGLSVIGNNLENAAKNKEDAVIEKNLLDLSEYLNRIEIVSE